MTDNLRKKTISAILWSGVEKVGIQIVQFAISIIIARILFPSDYGLIGMLAIFFSVSASFIDSGFNESLIQRKDAKIIDFSTIFYFNIAVSILFFSLLVICAPLIANFFDEPRLINLTRFMALNLIISSLGMVQNTYFRKNLDFKSIAQVRFLSVAFSGIIGITLAYRGFGVWSLAIQGIVGSFVRVLSYWVFSKWRPGFEFSFQSLKNLFPFGSRIFASSMLHYIFINIYNLVIGRYYSATDLGFYVKGRDLQERPVSIMEHTIEQVTFPVFASIQDDIRRLKAACRKIVKVAAFINFPLMFGLIVTAEPLITVLLTDKWLQSVIYVQILSLWGLVFTLSFLNQNILKSKGRSDIYLRLALIVNVLYLIAIIIGIKWGIIGLVIGRVIVSYIAYVLGVFYINGLIKYSIKEQISDILPYLFISMTMAILVYLAGIPFHEQALLKLIVQIFSGVVVYLGLAKMFRLEALKESVMIFKTTILPRIYK